MQRSGIYVTTLAILLGCGGPVEIVDNNHHQEKGGPSAAAGDDPGTGSYNFNPPPTRDMREPPEEDGGPSDPDDPNLLLSERSIFFEQTCAGSNNDHTLTLANNGGATLSIRDLDASGTGFSLPSPPSLPARISPGHSITLRVRFTPASERTSPYDGNLRILCNDPGNPTTNVPLSGIALPPTLSLSPRTVSFGTVRDGEFRTRHFTATNSGECSVRIGGSRKSGSLSDSVDVEDLPTRIGPNSSARIGVTLVCNNDDGNLDATVRLIDRNSRSLGSVQLTGACDD